MDAKSVVRVRPLEIKHLFDFAIRLYRQNFTSMLISMAIVQLPFALLTFPALLKLIEFSNALNVAQMTGVLPGSDFFMQWLDEGIVAVVTMFLALVYQVLITPLGNMAVARLAVVSIAGERIDWREAFGYARYRYWQTQVAIATFILPLLIVSLVVLLPVLALQAAGNEEGVLVSALIGMMLIYGGALATVLFFPRFFMAVNGVIQCAEDPEGEGMVAQGIWYLKRSFGLSANFFWRLLGLLLLLWFGFSFITKGIGDSINLIAILIESVISGADMMEQIIDPSRPQDLQVTGIAMVIATVCTLLILPIWQCFKVLLYYDLRCRKEAYDLHLLLDSEESRAKK